MNQGRIWTVVNPTVGLPLLLGSVTVIAILVHLALVTNTSWFPKYWNGATAVAAAPAPAPAAPAKK
ncbi:MAG: light-harvesting protein [Rhodopseudomonas sp.]|uniref:light-harvesting protein n=1 Tax=Rhodopseudomonas sp. TaxID=1078 RepID=UPI0018562C57|nr:light-harvesting protein [Rhodopseudomonas sp.]NVN87959.1 light-harvesting protein [Rhodopseudomonas sp.]